MINNNVNNLGLGNSPYKPQSIPDFELGGRISEDKNGEIRKAENAEREGAVADVNEGREVAFSKQGDELAVSRIGRASYEADGKVIEKNNDGVVAERDKKIIKEDELDNKPKDVSGQTESRVAEMIDEEAEKAAEKKAEAKKDKKAEEVKERNAQNDDGRNVVQTGTSLVGKSKEEVEQMYRDGEISFNQYESDMEKRDSMKPAADSSDGKMIQAMEEKDAMEAENKALISAAENGRAEEMADILAGNGLFNGGDINKMMNIDLN